MPRGSETTDRVKKLRRFDLEMLCRYSTYSELSDMLGVSTTTIKTELEKQLENRTFYTNTVPNTGEYERKLEVTEDTCGGGYGQWLNSDIRRFGKLMLKETDL